MRLIRLRSVAALFGAAVAVLTIDGAAHEGSARGLAVAGLSIALVMVFVVASFVGQWFDELVRRALRKVRSTPRPGYGVFQGVARSLDGERVLVSRTRSEFASPAGSDGWVEIDRVIAAPPFVLELAGGEEIEVDARAPSLEGFPEVCSRAADDTAGVRSQTARVLDGETVWVSGRLERAPNRSGGVYRTARVRRRIEARGAEPVVISRELPAARFGDRARAHRAGAYMAAAALAVLHATAWRRFDVALASGAAPNEAASLVNRGSIALGLVLLAGSLAWWFVRVSASRRRFG